jgi:hypothetical protein
VADLLLFHEPLGEALDNTIFWDVGSSGHESIHPNLFSRVGRKSSRPFLEVRPYAFIGFCDHKILLAIRAGLIFYGAPVLLPNSEHG